jgi:hypothetical protein
VWSLVAPKPLFFFFKKSKSQFLQLLGHYLPLFITYSGCEVMDADSQGSGHGVPDAHALMDVIDLGGDEDEAGGGAEVARGGGAVAATPLKIDREREKKRYLESGI